MKAHMSVEQIAHNGFHLLNGDDIEMIAVSLWDHV